MERYSRKSDSKWQSIYSEEVTNKTIEKDSLKSITELENELQEAKLLAEAYRNMIDIAEKEFKINIVKKSNTK